MDDFRAFKSYEGEHLRRIALPLGGIGTGTVSLGGRGNLRDWAIMNTPAFGYTPTLNRGMRNTGPFFALFTEKGSEKKAILLEGALNTEHFEAAEGVRVPNHGLPRFRRCRFDASYPEAHIHLQDDDVPLKVTLEAFNPFIPGDSDGSGIPGAILTYKLENQSSEPVDASVCGTILNIIGQDGRQYVHNWRWDNSVLHKGSRGCLNRLRKEDGLSGIHMTASGVSRRSPAWGSMSLTTDSEGHISFRESWKKSSWGNSMLDFWNDFSSDGVLEPRQAVAPFNRMGSLAVKQTVPPGDTREVRFFLTWHFPNRETWHPLNFRINGKLRYLVHSRIGNYYANRFTDSWDSASFLRESRPELSRKTRQFMRSFLDSNLPDSIKEAALFNASTLRTQTVFRSGKGCMYGWEGTHDTAGSCMGSCTHVWNYEQTTPYLFGSLARSMRTVEFLHSTRPDGHMNFRTRLPAILNRVLPGLAAADGQMGTIMKMHREWQLCGDDDFLRKLWPRVRKSLEFCWLPGGWDADKDGVMEGCQHNTMDVEYYGPNPQMQGWYLGALRASEEMARYLGETRFADTCRTLFLSGSRFMDNELFNGEYYEHQIQIPPKVRKGLTSQMGSKDKVNPTLQLGPGCLVDQLVGQYMAHICGLGYLLKPENVRRTLKSVMKYNFRESFHGHFNHFRSYVLNDESALLMASYPGGNAPEDPFPYYNEVMTGFEHCAAAHMLFEGRDDPELYKSGLKVIEAVRNRYDGFKRNPYDEAECGHHYARAMAAWAHVYAVSGFHYSAVTGILHFHHIDGVHFWASGDAWGTCRITGAEAEIHCLHGQIEIREFLLGDKLRCSVPGTVLTSSEKKVFSFH